MPGTPTTSEWLTLRTTRGISARHASSWPGRARLARGSAAGIVPPLAIAYNASVIDGSARMGFGTATACFVMLVALAGCGGGDSGDNGGATGGSGGGGGGGSGGGGSGGSGGGGGSGGSGTGGYTGTNPNADCPGKLEPVAQTGQVQTVGDGSDGELHRAGAARRRGRLNGVTGGGTRRLRLRRPAAPSPLTQSVLVSNTMIHRRWRQDHPERRRRRASHRARARTTARTSSSSASPSATASCRRAATDESGAGLLHPWFGTLRGHRRHLRQQPQRERGPRRGRRRHLRRRADQRRALGLHLRQQQRLDRRRRAQPQHQPARWSTRVFFDNSATTYGRRPVRQRRRAVHRPHVARRAHRTS